MKTKQAVVSLAALAQESRLRVFRLLVPAGGEGVPAGEIAQRLDIPPATLTFHLKELAHAGLIESRRQGRSISYSLCIGAMRDLLTFLTHDCCQGHPELCGGVSCQKGKQKRRRVAHR
ncbi:MAG TPA: helix-turn-helix domain-containing protein [Lacipirellulaceae bacterium]